MRSDWDPQPTVDGIVVRAWIGEHGAPDVIHVQGNDVADDISNLDQAIGDPENPDPNRPFVLTGKSGVIAEHGYKQAEELIGKRCLIFADGRTVSLSIESDSDENWPLVVWIQYV